MGVSRDYGKVPGAFYRFFPFAYLQRAIFYRFRWGGIQVDYRSYNLRSESDFTAMT